MAYPKELRQRVIKKDADGLTQTEIAEELSVSQIWVNKILRIYAQYGVLFPPREKSGPKPKLGDHERKLLMTWLAENHNLTHSQFADRMSAETGKAVNVVNVFTALKAMDYSHKKTAAPDEQRRADIQLSRRQWWNTVERIPARSLVFLDESSANTSLAQHSGWGRRGERILSFVPFGRWHTTTMICAIRRDGAFAGDDSRRQRWMRLPSWDM